MAATNATLPDGSQVEVDIDNTVAARSNRELPDVAEMEDELRKAREERQDIEDEIATGKVNKDNARQKRKRNRDRRAQAQISLEDAEADRQVIEDARQQVKDTYHRQQREQHGKEAAQAARRAVEGAAKLREQIEAAMQQREAVVREFRTALAEARKAGVEVSNMSSGSVMQVLDNYLPHLADKTRPEVNVPSITRPEVDIRALFGGLMADHGERPKVQAAQPENQAKAPEPRQSKQAILADHIGRQPTADEVERANKVGPFKAARLILEEEPQADVSEPEDAPGPVGGARRKPKGVPEGVGNAGLGVERSSAQEKVDAAAPKLEDDASDDA